MKRLVIIFTITALFASSIEEVKSQEKDDIKDAVAKETPTKPEETEVWEPVRAIVNPTGQKGVPSDAIVLFDGSNLDQWITAKNSSAAQWTLNGDGSMTVKDKTGDIQTKQNFGSIQLHLEWSSSPKNTAKGQARSNSGVFLQNRYEVQVLNNNDNPTYINGQAGSIYKQSPPLVQALVPTGDWNSYDIIYHAPEFNETGEKTKSATITVLHNGVLVQDHFYIQGTSEYIGLPKNDAHGPAPIKLQDHQDNSGVRYRNIWVREL
jgi:hypothetical protein